MRIARIATANARDARHRIPTAAAAMAASTMTKAAQATGSGAAGTPATNGTRGNVPPWTQSGQESPSITRVATPSVARSRARAVSAGSGPDGGSASTLQLLGERVDSAPFALE